MRTLTSCLIATVMLFLAGCMHNNGYIGNWFGTWHVTEITIDGVKSETYADNMFFKFQTDICDIVTVGDHNYYSEHFARWSETDNILTIDFSYTDEFYPPSFNPPAESMLESGPNLFEVRKKGNSLIYLTRHTSSGETIVYTLKKQ